MIWPFVQLKQIAVLGPQYGLSVLGAPWTGRRPRCIRSADIDQSGRIVEQGAVEADVEHIPEHALQDGDLLFSRAISNAGKTYRHGMTHAPSVFARHLIRFRLDPRLAESRFVYFFTHSAGYKNWLSAKKLSAGRSELNGSDYASLSFPLPPLSEQQKIVHILEQADALQRKRVEANAQVGRFLPNLFYRLFGDLADNPKGWPLVPLRTIITAMTGGIARPSDSTERGTQILKMFNILDGGLDLSRVHRVEVGPAELADYRLVEGDLLINRMNISLERVGKCAVIPAGLGDVVFDNKIARLRLDTTRAISTYVAQALNTPFAHAILCKGIRRGGAMAMISTTDIQNCSIPLPPLQYQRQWSQYVGTVRSVVVNADTAGSNLQRLYHALLHRAFSGELTRSWRTANSKEWLAEVEQQSHDLRSITDGRN